MKPSVSIPLLILVICAVTLTHISAVETQEGTLILLDGRKVDGFGYIKNQWTSKTRNCENISKLQPEDASYREAEKLIRTYSPPGSQSAKIASAWATGPWVLIEVEFDVLLPAVVTLRKVDGKLTIVPQGIWSGYTQPWLAGPFIRNYLSKQTPEMPTSLLDCFDPQSKSFK